MTLLQEGDLIDLQGPLQLARSVPGPGERRALAFLLPERTDAAAGNRRRPLRTVRLHVRLVEPLFRRHEAGTRLK